MAGDGDVWWVSRWASALSIGFVLIWGPWTLASPPTDEMAPQIGLNFIRLAWPTRGPRASEALPDDFLLDDLDALKVDAVRQFVRADLLWREMEPVDDQWDFSRADAAIDRLGSRAIVTLFGMQYASATPHWATEDGDFRATLGPAAKDYLDTVVRRYADRVRFYEIGNEMDHWRAADPGVPIRHDARLPPHRPPGGFTPVQQGAFIAEVAAFIRARDPDAVIVLPGMAGLSEYVLQTWLPGVVRGGGVDAFDVVNYHFYREWHALPAARERLRRKLDQLGLSDKPVWCTETGSTTSPTLRMRTDYPNSRPSQVADVFRRLLPAWAAGDQLVLWHTHLSSPDRPGNRWRLYGLRMSDGRRLPSWFAFQLLATEVVPFAAVTPLDGLSPGQFGYRVQRLDGGLRWVMWGQGRAQRPPGAAEWTSVAPEVGGGHRWQGVGAEIPLSVMPVLLRDAPSGSLHDESLGPDPNADPAVEE